MSDRRLRPPDLPRRLLRAALPPGSRGDAVLGDLEEEFGVRADRSPALARVWYWREATVLAVRYRTAGWWRPGPSGSGRNGETRGGRMLETTMSNVRYAVRRLARSPLFTGIAVTSLALGIGANTAIFSLVDAVVFRDQPFADPESLVDLYYRTPGFSHGVLSYPDFRDLEAASDGVLEGIAAAQFAFVQVDVEDGVRMAMTEAVNGAYFEALGIRAHVGRLLGSEDDVAAGAHPVVVLGHAYWSLEHAADPGVVGTEMRLGGRPYTVAGVAPEEYRGIVRGLEPEIFVPILMYEELQPGSRIFEQRQNHGLFAKARVAGGVAPAALDGFLDRMTTSFRADHPDAWTSADALFAVPTSEVVMNPMIDRVLVPAAGTIMVVVGLVLLIACANLASFLLAQATDRRREIAVRLALGARRSTLLGQLLTETVLLSMAGGAAGVALAGWGLRAFLGADLPLPLPITIDASIDGSVLTFSFAASLLAGILFGLAPALQATRPDVSSTLRDESTGVGRGRGGRLRDALVIGQVTVSFVLLVAAGLFLRSLDASRRIDPGFGAEPAGIAELVLSPERFPGEEGHAFLDRVRERIASIPGVRAVGATSNLHLNPTNTGTVQLVVDGVPAPEGQDYHQVDYARIDEGYVDAAGLTLLEGRGFARSDGPDGEQVVIVNQAFVDRFFPSGDVLGKTVRRWEGEAATVVGVVATARIRQLGEEPRAFVYGALRQSTPTFVSLVASTSDDAARTAQAMFGEIRALDPQAMVYETKTMERHLAVMLLPRQLGAVAVSGFALLALVLATIGLYGIVSYAVSRRVREVGIRLSLGAEAEAVTWMLTLGGLRLVAVGGALGVVLAAALARLLSRLLYGVPPLDPVTFLGVPVLFALVAGAASWIPARRATRVDPVRALRAE